MREASAGFLYEKYVNMIRERAWHFARCYNRDVDELISVGNMTFMRAWQIRNPRMNFGTLLTTCLNRSMIRHVQKNDLPKDLPEEDFWHPIDLGGDPYQHLIFKEMLGRLSREAKHVVTLVLNGPAEVLEIFGPTAPVKIRCRVKKYLVAKRGLSQQKADLVVKEIRRALRHDA